MFFCFCFFVFFRGCSKQSSTLGKQAPEKGMACHSFMPRTASSQHAANDD